jgi:1,5-anhydro-D-fructose reductase (1,5-anhydro-D-mannitol-forming)
VTVGRSNDRGGAERNPGRRHAVRHNPAHGAVIMAREVGMESVRWGMIGCGDVAEVKAGPAFQKASGSSLVAIMRRDLDKARDFAARHGVERVHATAADLIADPEVDAVYIATPPSSHCDLALSVARARKPCVVEKPMAMNHRECVRMVDAFDAAGCSLWVAYYRRALPRYLLVRDLMRGGTIGRLTSVQIEVFDRLASGDLATAWRFDPAIAGGGLFLDMGSHCMDMIDFLVGPLEEVSAVAINTGGTYRAEDVTVAAFRAGADVACSGVWNFNADRTFDQTRLVGSSGTITFPMFSDGDVVVSDGRRYEVRNPPHVHQPLIQTIVDELRGRGRCESTARSGSRTAAVMDRCLARYYGA